MTFETTSRLASGQLPRRLGIAFVLACGLPIGPAAFADRLTIRTDGGGEETVVAEIYGQARGALLLLKDDGRIDFVADANVIKREPTDEFEPITPEEMAKRLEERFTPELCRTIVAGNNVVAVKLQAEVDRAAELRMRSFFAKVEQFVLTLGKNFKKWADAIGLPDEDPRFPLVMIIFETDEDFEEYASRSTGEGLSVGNLAGFYSHNTNWLAVRADECDNYTLPLHEGIHQQVYNRGWYKRFAPVPVWFDEGIATGFENDGDRLRGDPSKVNRLYATKSAGNMALSFTDVIESDAGFRGDVLAGDAYTRAWALHWLLVNHRKPQYISFVKSLRNLEPLEKRAADDRLRNFEELFGVAPAELQPLYERELDKAARRQRVKPLTAGPPGITRQQDQSGAVDIRAIVREQGLSSQGTLRNISPFRALTFRVRVITDASPPIEWVMPNVGSRKLVKLPMQTIPYRAQTFRVEVKSAIPDSRQAQIWMNGSAAE